MPIGHNYIGQHPIIDAPHKTALAACACACVHARMHVCVQAWLRTRVHRACASSLCKVDWRPQHPTPSA